MYSFSFSPRRRFVLQTEISGKYILLFIFNLISASFFVCVLRNFFNQINKHITYNTNYSILTIQYAYLLY